MIVCAEIGNSGLRLAGYHHRLDAAGQPLWRTGLQHLGEIDRLVPLLVEPGCQWMIASVHAPRLAQLREWLRRERPLDRVFHVQNSDIPLRTDLEHPERAGTDRLLAAWYACRNRVATSEGAIVVDAGTAVTVDWVDSRGVFRGGNIFPGAYACLRQLAGTTDQLPHLEEGAWPPLPYGRNTRDAILGGVYRSQAASIEGLVRQLQSHAGIPDAAVLMTGGGIPPIQSLLPGVWQYDRDLLLKALLALTPDPA